MKIGLCCSDNLKRVILELMSARNFLVDNQTEFVIVESGCEIPRGKVAILFEVGNLASLIELLDRLSKGGEEAGNAIIGKLDEKYERIPLNQVYFYEGRGNNVFCITSEGEYRVKEKLYELEEKLPQHRFIRVSKSFIVNITNVKEIIPWFGRRLILRFNDQKKEIEVSKNYVKSFKEFLGI
ncbi:MAG: LytTR family transcriptional regulator [Clostridia bacterium]|nr:LytTR family transcriptional regulator [Clostridia bacterium]